MTQLVQTYTDFLVQHGIDYDAQLIASIMEADWAALYGQIIGGPVSHSDPYDEILTGTSDTAVELGMDQFLLMLAVVQEHSRQIQKTIDFDSIDIPMSVIAGVFPTGSFNAQAVPANGGALLLLNLGLFSFIHKVLRLLSYDVEYPNLIPPLLHMYDVVLDGLDKRATLQRERLAELLLLEITRYLLFGNPFAISELGPQTRVSTNVIHSFYIMATELFALAHEYAHAILGHLDTGRTALATSDSGPVRFFTKSQRQEFNADFYAVHTLMLGSLSSDYRSPRMTDSTHRFQTLVNSFVFFSAPIVFFLLDDTVTVLAKRLSGRSDIGMSSTHPASKARITNLMASYAKLVSVARSTRRTNPHMTEQNLAMFVNPALWCMRWFLEMQERMLAIVDRI